MVVVVVVERTTGVGRRLTYPSCKSLENSAMGCLVKLVRGIRSVVPTVMVR